MIDLVGYYEKKKIYEGKKECFIFNFFFLCISNIVKKRVFFWFGWCGVEKMYFLDVVEEILMIWDGCLFGWWCVNNIFWKVLYFDVLEYSVKEVLYFFYGSYRYYFYIYYYSSF